MRRAANRIEVIRLGPEYGSADFHTLAELEGHLCHQIAEAARACLRGNHCKVFAAVSCRCESGVLLLRGRVSSFYLKQVAQESVARVEGVMQVVNEIGVFPEERSPRSTS